MMSSLHPDLEKSNEQPPPHLQRMYSHDHRLLSLSPRLGIDDLPPYCTSYPNKMGYTPRDNYSTGLTPRFNTPYPVNPRGVDSNMVSFDRISPSGYTPKDMPSMKLPMRFPDMIEPTATFASEMHGYLQRPVLADSHDDLDERRRMKNRERVRKCRKRKQDRLNYLEDRTNALERENSVLKSRIEKENLSPVELEELQNIQNTVISQYVSSFYDAAFAAVNTMYSDTAQIIYGNRGTAAFGLDEIVRGRRQFADAFATFTMKPYSVIWSMSTHSQCALYLNMEVSLKIAGEEQMPFAAPFRDLARFIEPDSVLGFRMVCYITFRRDKIVREIRQLDLQQVADMIIAKKGGVANEVLKLLI